MTKAINKKYYTNEASLTKAELNFFKTELEEKKIKIQKNLHITSSELSSNSSNELKDEGDHASHELENSTNTAIILEQSKTLKQIDRCLNKISIGTYGVCNLCDENIDVARLKVKIFAEYCISCREIIEKQNRAY